jgi:hypothetical protein
MTTVRDLKQNGTIRPVTTFERKALEVARLLEKKNADYGGSYDEIREEFGELSFLIRFTDKYKRVRHLIKGGELQVKEEKIEDSLMDLAGYCILELLYREGNAERTMESDAKEESHGERAS